jgi:hypothetical protein
MYKLLVSVALLCVAVVGLALVVAFMHFASR